MHGDARIEGFTFNCTPLKALLALNYNSFILTVGFIAVDSHARDMVIVKVHVYCWKYHPCINQYNILHVGMRIYKLKGVHIANFEVDLVQAVLNTVVHQTFIVYTNVLVNSAVIQQFMQICFTLLLIHVDTGPQELYQPLLVITENALYNVMGVERHIMPVIIFLKVRVSVELLR